MRLLTLDLERYGTFTGRQLVFNPQARLHIVHGANEAGKTTALAAITDLLCGYEAGIKFKSQPGDTFRLGATLLLADGSTRKFRRRRGKNITIVDANDQPLGEDFLDAVTGGLTREKFRSEFGLTASDLRRGGHGLLETKGRLAEMLASGSAGLSALLQLEKGIAGEADKLFGKTRVASKPFYEAVEKYEAHRKQFALAIVNDKELASADAVLLEKQAAEQALLLEMNALLAEKARLERVGIIGPLLMRLGSNRAELQELAHWPQVEEAARQEWRKAMVEHEELARQIASLEQDRASDERRLETLQRSPQLLEAEAEINALHQRLGAVRQAETDLPNRLAEREEAQARLQELAQKLRLADVAALLERQPAETELAAMRSQVARARKAGDELAAVTQVLGERKAALARLLASVEHQSHPVDPAPLRQRLESFADVPGECDTLRRETAQTEARTRELDEALARLRPAIAGVDALVRLAIPGPETVHAARTSHAALERDRLELASKQMAALGRQADVLADIARLATQGLTTSPGDLALARAARDATLLRLGDALDTAGYEKHNLYAALKNLGGRADELADNLIRNGEQLAKREVLEAQLATAKVSVALCEADVNASGQRAKRAQEQWLALWADSGVQPLEPAVMALWRENVIELLQTSRNLAGQRATARALQAGLAEKRPHLAQLARETGVQPDETMPPDLLWRQTGLALQAMERAWGQARDSAATRKALESNLAEAEQNCAAATQSIAAAHPGWLAALARLQLAATATAAEAEAALDLWQKVEGWREKLADASHRVAGIEQRQGLFSADASALAGRLNAELADKSASYALETLMQHLGSALRVEGDWQGLNRNQRDRDARIADLRARQSRMQAILAAAQQILPEGTGLAQALEAMDRRKVLLAEQRQPLEDLRRHANGRSEAELSAELDALGGPAGLDLIEGLKQAAQAQADEKNSRYRQAITEQFSARQARDLLGQGRDAAGAQQAQTEWGAEVLRTAREWLVRQAAASLARAAIERHRAQSQHPVIARASAMFAGITSGLFAGLVADYDDRDNSTLKGVRAGGARAGVEEMSEGTLDQMYLVLRLALLDQLGSERLPFIGDDLLASFDEARTGEMLEVLARFGERQQVILFTHHAHVAEIARQRLGTMADVVGL